MRGLRWTVLAATMFAGLAGAAPASAGTLDQQQTVGADSVLVGTCSAIDCGSEMEAAEAQTFTAGLSGALDRLDLVLQRTVTTAAPLTVEVQTVADDGCPSGTVLASAQVPAAVVSDDAAGLVAVNFPAPASVVAGGRYAMVLYAAPPNAYAVSLEQFDNPYAGGQSCWELTTPPSSAPPSTWESRPDADLVFNTYVAPRSTDADPPETTITKHPRNRLDRSKAKFKFTADEAGASFECKIDRKPFKSCTSPKAVKRLDDGKHKFKVRAIDAAGNVDVTPAKDRFRVVP